MSALSYHTKHCMALAKWASMQRGAVYPLHALVYIPNDGKRTPVSGRILKAMGMTKGVWDYLLAAPSRRVLWSTDEAGVHVGAHGLWIEMKSEDDELSKEQELWGRIVRKQRYATVVCRTWIAARDNILDYLGVPHTPSTTKGQEWLLPSTTSPA